jgi:hypothetical protein
MQRPRQPTSSTPVAYEFIRLRNPAASRLQEPNAIKLTSRPSISEQHRTLDIEIENKREKVKGKEASTIIKSCRGQGQEG